MKFQNNPWDNPFYDTIYCGKDECGIDENKIQPVTSGQPIERCPKGWYPTTRLFDIDRRVDREFPHWVACERLNGDTPTTLYCGQDMCKTNISMWQMTGSEEKLAPCPWGYNTTVKGSSSLKYNLCEKKP